MDWVRCPQDLPNSFSTEPGLWLRSCEVAGSRLKNVTVVLLETRNWVGVTGSHAIEENSLPAFIGTQDTGLSGWIKYKLMREVKGIITNHRGILK